MMPVIIKDTTQTQYKRTFETLAEADAHRDEHVSIERSHFKNTLGQLDVAIEVQRAYRFKMDYVTIEGIYDWGVRSIFNLHANLSNVNVTAGNGFWIGNGVGVWEHATPSNSSSNQNILTQCRFSGTKPGQIGFYVEGASNLSLIHCTVEGKEFGVAFNINPRGPQQRTLLQNAWIEAPHHTTIRYDGHSSVFTIEGLNLAVPPSTYLLNTAGDQGSTVIFRDCPFEKVPPIRLDATTKVVLGEGNRFTEEAFWKAVTRA